MKVSQKLGLGFGLCLFLALAAGIVGIREMSAISDNARLLKTDALGGNNAMTKIVSDVKRFRALQLRYIIAQDPKMMSSIENEVNQESASIDKDFSDYDSSITIQEDRDNLATLKAKWATYRQFDDAIHQASRANNMKLCDKIINVDSLPAYNAEDEQGALMLDWNMKRGAQLAKQAQDTFESGRNSMIGLLLFALICGTIAAYSSSRYVTSNLTEIAGKLDSLNSICIPNLGSAVHALASGDLTATIVTGTTLLEVNTNDEFGVVGKTLNQVISQTQSTIGSYREAQAGLAELIGQARISSENISSSSAEVASGNHDLAVRTTEQASSLEETAASMEEITSIVQQSAENAKHANTLAHEAKEVAQNGGKIVQSAVTSMQGIKESSNKIAEIITVIDEIAFQTNLLALNAAVEAARVGEQGKGFAVVASEVRNLAGRSSTAAKEIKTLVQDSVHRVEEGSGLVIKSGEELKEIVSSVEKVAAIVLEITSAAQEQSAGIEQINKAVMQMDEITQQNAALVEQTAAASQAVSHQASDLEGLVGQFKLEGSGTRRNVVKTTSSYSAQSTGTHGKSAPKSGQGSSQPNLRMVDSSSMEEF
jgi:methyl-accepting chemotaxis protein